VGVNGVVVHENSFMSNKIIIKIVPPMTPIKRVVIRKEYNHM